MEKLITWAITSGQTLIHDFFLDSLFAKALWISVIVTFIFEKLWPADKKQKLFSVSFFHDFVWFCYQAFLHGFIILTYIAILQKVYTDHLSFLTITSLNQWPAWARFITAVLLSDFLYWLQHYINHKVPFLWRMHMVHHSQKELNFFSDFRYHIVEYFIRDTILAIPFLILQFDAPTIVIFSIWQKWYTRFYHGNIRTNLGPLKYILVTPQSHRVHHSIEQNHFDKNFGSLFCIWDLLFKTQCRDYAVYPATGIPDQEFPHETKITFSSLFLTPFKQMLYSFKKKK